MRRAILIIVILASGCRTTDAPRRLDALFSDLHQRGLFDGAVVVGQGREVVWEKGYGLANVERQVPFTPDTPSDGASLAKTFTAAIVLMLARDGALDLDAPAQRLLPELPYPDITLRHLLSHSSGLPVLDYDFFDRYLPPDRIRTTEELLRVLGNEKPALVSAPGTAFEYSSFGYDLAALAGARAAGKPFGELLRERIFLPLGITSAFLRPGRLSEFPGVRTVGYRRVDGKLQLNEVFDMEAFHGGSNIYISAHDLHRWNASPLSEAQTEFARVGGAASALTLGNWYRSADGELFSYAGHLQGFHSEVFRNTRSRRSIVYVSNNTIDPWMQHGIVRAVNAILDGRELPSLTAPAVDAVPKEDRGRLAGRWGMPDGDVLTIELAERRLSMSRNGVSYRMVQVEPRAFYVPGLDYMVGLAGDRIYVSSNFDERWSAARASSRVESSVGNAEFESSRISGSSVHPRITASQPSSLMRAMTR